MKTRIEFVQRFVQCANNLPAETISYIRVILDYVCTKTIWVWVEASNVYEGGAVVDPDGGDVVLLPGGAVSGPDAETDINVDSNAADQVELRCW